MKLKESPTMEFDPITLEVLWQRLISIAEEQAKTLTRAAFSSQAGEMEDISSGVFDVEGRMIAQGVTGTVGVLTALVRGVPEFLRVIPPEEIAPGDVLISNDPWLLAGHLNDIAIVIPVFFHTRLVGFTATMSHATDIGGKTWSSDYGEVYEEGLWIPPVKLYNEGKPNRDVFRIIEQNVRMPEQVMGDIMAQVTACTVGASRTIELMQEQCLTHLEDLSFAILSRSEAAVRKAIAPLPRGVFRSHAYMDGFEEPLQIAVAVRIDEDGVTVDYAGSPAQVPYAINSVYNFTLAHTIYAIKCALFPEIPDNYGCFLPIKVECPEANLMNCRPPAPVVSRHLTCSFINSALSNALAQVVPDAVNAESGVCGTPVFSGVDDRKGKRFIYWFLSNGGMGARPNKDGLNATSFPANIATVAAEIVENVSPLFIVKKEILADSGGAGKYRGGCGTELVVKVRSNEPVTFSPVYDRTRFLSQGLHGGQGGTATKLYVNGSPIHAKKKITLQPGDELKIQHGGGGGFFSPVERNPEKVLHDVKGGYVSLEAAAAVYKVAIDSGTWRIDWDGTKRLRSG